MFDWADWARLVSLALLARRPEIIPDPPPELRDVLLGIVAHNIAAQLTNVEQREVLQQASAEVVREGAQRLTKFQ